MSPLSEDLSLITHPLTPETGGWGLSADVDCETIKCKEARARERENLSSRYDALIQLNFTRSVKSMSKLSF